MKFLNDLKLGTKILVLCSVLLLSFIIFIEGFVIPTINETVEAKSISKMQSLVEAAYSTLEYYYNQAQSGALTQEKAKELAKNEIKRIRYGNDDYFWINDYTPTMIMHPIKSELDGQNLSDYKDPTDFKLFVAFVEVVKAKGEGVVNYQWPKPGKDKPQPKMSYVKGFSQWQWVLGSGIYIDDLDEIKAGINNKIRVFLIAFVILTIAMMAIIVIPLNLSVKKLLKHLERLSNYDFSKLIDIEQKDEIGIVAKAFNNMITRVQALLREVENMGVNVAESSQDVMSSSRTMSRVSGEVAAATSELAKGSTEQAESTIRSKDKIDEIVDGLGKIVADMEHSEELTQKSKEMIEIGQKSVHYQQEKMLISKQITTNVGTTISKLSERSKEIGHIVDVIKGIAIQTEMLSLNAAIEAAHAGEQGKGFAVVSGEVKKLAEQSGKSVKQIQNIVNEVMEIIEQTVAEVNNVEAAVEEQEKALSDTINSFGTITGIVIRIAERVKDVTKEAHQLNTNAKQAEDEINRIAGIAQNAAAGTEQVAASANEQTETIQQITKYAEELSSLANKLQDSLHKFVV